MSIIRCQQIISKLRITLKLLYSNNKISQYNISLKYKKICDKMSYNSETLFLRFVGDDDLGVPFAAK